MVPKMSLAKRLGPYWAIECPNVQIIKKVGLDQWALNSVKCNHLTPLALKELNT